MVMTHHRLLGLNPDGFHRLHYTAWGDPANPRVVVCVHGLTRNGRDFDALAEALAADFRVLCPDVVGRGQSDWLPDPRGYGYPQYLSDMTALIARSGAEQVDWVGTSMGGLIGMLLAARPGTPVRRMVINDVGPYLPRAALARIAAYVGIDVSFPDLDAMQRYYREVAAPFGPLTDAQWRHLVEHGSRPLPDGHLAFGYDPDIAVPFRGAIDTDVDLWPVWDALSCPTLLLRGVDSDLLGAETACEMTRRGPAAQLIEFEGIGHAPMLMAADQIRVVRDWLLEG